MNERWESPGGKVHYHPNRASWDEGTWRASGLSGGGHASAQVWKHRTGHLIGVSAAANLTPAQARLYAEALLRAAAHAEKLDEITE